MDCAKKLEEKTNIHADVEFVKGSDWNTKINLMFASGNYVDVIMGTNSAVDAEEYGVSQQLILPVDDLVNQYMPTYKQRAEAEPTDVLPGLKASDGKMYSIGYLVAQNINCSGHFFVNKTWLSKLGMEAPKTVDELTNMLRAFKTKDPNGNGQADEIPYGATFNSSIQGITNAFSFWGIPLESFDTPFVLDNDKKVQFAPYMSGFRNTVEWLHQLYSEGLLDSEVLSQDTNMMESKVTDGSTGFFTDWRLLSSPYTEWAKDNAVIMNPVTASGYQICMPKTMELASKGAYVTTTNKHIPETMRWLDAQLETETMFSFYYGEQNSSKTNEGWKYNSDGLIESQDTGTTQSSFDYLNCNALFFAPGKYYNSVYKMAPQRVEKTQYCEQYTQAGYMQKYSNKLMALAPRTADEISKCTLLLTDISKAVKENVTTFITKGVTDDSWNAFIKALENTGVKEYISIYQNALDKMQD